MSVYPRNMSAFLNRLSGYNKNNVKMNVLGSSTANDGDVIQVDLPTNSIVDLSSLAWSFTTTYTGKAGQAARGARRPPRPQGADVRRAELARKKECCCALQQIGWGVALFVYLGMMYAMICYLLCIKCLEYSVVNVFCARARLRRYFV